MFDRVCVGTGSLCPSIIMLPPDSTYSLLGQPKAKPGDPLAGERQALVLRLSRQALDALDVQPAPTVEVDFDTQPVCIHAQPQ